MGKYGKALLLALKIGIGTSLAIYIAQLLNLEYAISAGTVTLLTLMMSKWATIRLSAARLATFAMTVMMAWVVLPQIDSMWISYGVLLTLVVFVTELFGWQATISVNAVVALHLLTSPELDAGAVHNEFLIVLIGIVLAILLNLFNANLSHKRKIIADMRDTESGLQAILQELGAYLSGEDLREDVWKDIDALEERIQAYIKSASEYEENTFASHTEYYISYFRMRYEQCQIMHNLHDGLVKIHDMPRQAATVAEYILYLSQYVVELNHPTAQIQRLDEIFEDMRDEELPRTRSEFENRAMLYHVLMDLRDFLAYKADFVDRLDQVQLTRYWRKDCDSKATVETGA